MPAKVTNQDNGTTEVLSETETQSAIAAATVGLAPTLTGVGNPNGVTTGLFGQLYYDSFPAGHWYRCINDPSGTEWVLT